MKTSHKVSNSARGQRKQPSVDSIANNAIKEDIKEKLTSWESKYGSKIATEVYIGQNKYNLKKGISDTSREEPQQVKKCHTHASILLSSPRLLQEQVAIIHFFKQKNKTPKEESEQKEYLISKLVNKTSIPKSMKTTRQPPPKTSDCCQYSGRFPSITAHCENAFQVPLAKKQVQNNDQNWSFGKLPDETNKSQSQFCKLLNGKNCKSAIKTNFSKPLLKLPKEFHLQSWNPK